MNIETSEFWIQVKNEYIKSIDMHADFNYLICYNSELFNAAWHSMNLRLKIRELFNEFYILLGEPEEIIIPILNHENSGLFYVNNKWLRIKNDSLFFREFAISQRLQFIVWCIERFKS